MANEDGSVWVSFNGEIYNFTDLRSELKAKGHRFASNSDTEVLVHGYEEWGESMLTRLRGMFAFAIYDTIRDSFLFARDPFGIKPLYYLADKNRFAVASELKALMAGPWDISELDRRALAGAFAFGVVPAPFSIRKGVHKLLPGHLAVYDRDGNIRTTAYHRFEPGDATPSPKQAAEEIANAIKESVSLQNISDVPLGLFLSGGLDSSTVAWAQAEAAHPLKAFHFAFDGDPLAEENEAVTVARLCGHPLEVVRNDHSCLNLLDTLVVHYDEPFADTSMIPTYLISKAAAKGNGYKVVLAGDGGDELFAGYLWHQDALGAAKGLSGNESARAMATAYADKPYDFFLAPRHAHLFTPNFRALLEEWREDLTMRMDTGSPSLKTTQMCDLGLYLPDDILTKVDRASMANSLEVRVPFCDHILAGKVLANHPSVYATDNEGKALIKRILADSFPASVVQKKKRGFSIPLSPCLEHFNFTEKISNGCLPDLDIFEDNRLDDFLTNTKPTDATRLAFLNIATLWGDNAGF